MIKVHVLKEKIEIIGHSNYDEWGKDIVCSAVSSIVITSINGILSIDSKALEHTYQKDKLTITILKKDDITMKLINNMLELLTKLSQDYPQNIMVKEIR